MTYNNLLIGAISGNYTPNDLNNWIETSNWEDCDRVLLLYNPSNNGLEEYLQSHNITIITPDFDFWGNETTNFEFNIVKEYQQALKKFLKAKTVIDKSVDQHVDIIFENADNFQTARKLIEILKDEIEFRVRQYTHQLGNTTFNYRNWLIEDYHLKLRQKLNAKYRELALKE
jgi:hypothetical protein